MLVVTYIKDTLKKISGREKKQESKIETNNRKAIDPTGERGGRGDNVRQWETVRQTEDFQALLLIARCARILNNKETKGVISESA